MTEYPPLVCNNKYQFSNKSKTISLPVEIKNLPSKLEIEGRTLFPKEFFHVSLVYIGKIIEKNNITIPDFENQVVADFYCREKLLAIELDGFQHIENREYDKERDKFFEFLGIETLRFWNSEINKSLDDVLERFYLD